MFPGSVSIAALSNKQQLELVQAIEKSAFFEALRVHTLLGFLGSPAYGGNRGQVGWKYIGFEDRMRWEPPFGYYDAEAQ
jgi:gluconate 2-dehydrogenase gamma chain